MCTNSWRGKVILSLFYLELKFAALHIPGDCCRGSISLAYIAVFLQDRINGLFFIVYSLFRKALFHVDHKLPALEAGEEAF